jgi:hypothetical protein
LLHDSNVADSKIEDAIRHIDDVIQESERVRARIEEQLRRRAIWPDERGRGEPEPPRESGDDRSR